MEAQERKDRERRDREIGELRKFLSVQMVEKQEKRVLEKEKN